MAYSPVYTARLGQDAAERPGMAQWAALNSMTSYPFKDGCVPDGFPLDAIVDMLVAMPGVREVALSCLYIGTDIASVSVSVGGETCLFASVVRGSYEEYAPVAMESTVPGVSGFVAFGAVEFGTPRMFRTSIPLEDSAVARVPDTMLRMFRQGGYPDEAHGSVRFELPPGVSSEVDNSGKSSVVKLSMDKLAREQVPAKCSEGSPSSIMRTPVKTLNGLAPDDDGTVAVVFVGKSWKEER